ncbi:MFS transporter [Achromobacter xylosoxidans]
MIAYSASMPISGALADRVGRRLVLGSSWLLFAALFIPMIHYALGNPESLPWIMVVAMSLIGLGSGAVAASFAEQFPTSVRAIGWGCPTTFPLPCLAAPRRISAPGSPVKECPTCSIGMSWRFAS